MQKQIQQGADQETRGLFESHYQTNDTAFFDENLQQNDFRSYSAGLRAITLLHYIRNNNIEKVKTCLSQDENLSNSLALGTSALHLALTLGHDEIVFLLLKIQNINLNLLDQLGDFPLILACANGRSDIVSAMLENPFVNINKEHLFFLSSLTYAVFLEEFDIAKLLLNDARLDPTKHPEALNWAIRLKQESLVRLMLDKGFCAFDLTPTKILSEMQDDSDDTQIGHRAGELPLFWACEAGLVDVARGLVKKGATILHKNRSGHFIFQSLSHDHQKREFFKDVFPLQVEANNNSIGSATPSYITESNRFFNAHKSSKEIGFSDANWSNLLEYVLNRNAQQLKEKLIQLRSSKPPTDDQGNTLLHYAVTIPDNVEVICILLDANIDVNSANKRGATPILSLLLQPFCSIINLEVLLQGDSDITHQDEFGNALHYAIEYKHLAAIERLLMANADPNSVAKNGVSAFQLAYQKSIPAFSILEAKSRDNHINTQAIFKHFIIENFLLTLRDFVEREKMHAILIMLIDPVIKHQVMYQRYLESIDVTTEFKSLIAQISSMLFSTSGHSTFKFISEIDDYGVLANSSLDLYDRHMGLEFIKAILKNVSLAKIQAAALTVFDYLDSPGIKSKISPTKESEIERDIYQLVFTHAIDKAKITFKDDKYGVLPRLLIARSKYPAKTESQNRSSNSRSDLEVASEILEAQMHGTTNLYLKMTYAMLVYLCKPSDNNIRVAIAKFALAIDHDKQLQLAVNRLHPNCGIQSILEIKKLLETDLNRVVDDNQQSYVKK